MKDFSIRFDEAKNKWIVEAEFLDILGTQSVITGRYDIDCDSKVDAIMLSKFPGIWREALRIDWSPSEEVKKTDTCLINAMKKILDIASQYSIPYGQIFEFRRLQSVVDKFEWNELD